MRLFYIDKPGCYHSMDITKRVQKIYQLEVEFDPYLIVDFWGNIDEEPASISLYMGDDCVITKMAIDLDKKEEFENLRNIIWKYLEEFHNPTQVQTDKKGCLKNMEILQKNRVIQGWKNKLRNSKNVTGCYIGKNPDAAKYNETSDQKYNNTIQDRYKNNTMTPEDRVKFWLYRDPIIFPKPDIDHKRCKQLRYQDCTDNFPPGTPLHTICIDESKWLCDKWYSGKNDVVTTDKLLNITENKLNKYLADNDTKVDKHMFDAVIDAGMFGDLGNRAGNKKFHQNFPNTGLDYGSGRRLEGFYNNNNNSNKCTYYYIFIVILLIIIIVFSYKITLL
jgi:hypothetical protein